MGMGKSRGMKSLAGSDWLVMAVEMCGKARGADVASDLDVPSSVEVSLCAYPDRPFSQNHACVVGSPQWPCSAARLLVHK
jgi:hypothetical protein